MPPNPVPNPPVVPGKPVVSASDPGPSPGPEFVKIKWKEAIGGEPVGGIEWCEQRRAANLVSTGHVDLVVDPEPVAKP